MDQGNVGSIAGWIGGGLGVLGGLVGTYFSIKNTTNRRERAFMIKASIACWLLVATFVALLLAVPSPYAPLLWIVYVPLLCYGIRASNRIQTRLRDEGA